jgi:hypothetical protein
MPEEGGFAWRDGMPIPAGSRERGGRPGLHQSTCTGWTWARRWPTSPATTVWSPRPCPARAGGQGSIRGGLPGGCRRQSPVVADGDILAQSGAGGIRGEVQGCLRPRPGRLGVQLSSHPAADGSLPFLCQSTGNFPNERHRRRRVDCNTLFRHSVSLLWTALGAAQRTLNRSETHQNKGHRAMRIAWLRLALGFLDHVPSASDHASACLTGRRATLDVM